MSGEFYKENIEKFGEIIRLLNEFEFSVIERGLKNKSSDGVQFLRARLDEITSAGKPIRELFKQYVATLNEEVDSVG